VRRSTGLTAGCEGSKPANCSIQPAVRR
jgi:hypothetical protein